MLHCVSYFRRGARELVGQGEGDGAEEGERQRQNDLLAEEYQASVALF